jgi:fermentation-respiration switch protein FrsA (DUF1100 family)
VSDINWVFWTLLFVAVVGVLGTIIWVVGGSYVIAYLATFPPRRRLKRTPEKFGAAFENVNFPSRDGTMLSGWFVPSSSPDPQGVVVLCHGMMANRAEMMPWAESLWKKGLALLMFDFRGTSLSEGDKCTAGCYEPQDLHGALDYIETRPDCAGLPIGAFGFSMGGATVIMAAADDPRIQAIVSHGAYATLYGAIQQRCKHHFGPLAPIAVRIIMRLGNRRKWFVASPFGVAPLKAVARLTPRPLLLLHGERDPIIPAHHARKLYAAATGPKELHMLPRSRHKRINRKIRSQAHDRVVQFFCDHLD